MIDLAGVNTKALDELTEEAFTFFERSAEIDKLYNRPGHSQETLEHLEVIKERIRRLQNTVNALMPNPA